MWESSRAPAWRKQTTPAASEAQVYTVRQVDREGAIISEEQVEADSANAALRGVRRVSNDTHGIEVYNAKQKQVRQILGDYWRLKGPRR